MNDHGLNDSIYRRTLESQDRTHAAWEAHLADLAEFERSVNRTIDALARPRARL